MTDAIPISVAYGDAPDLTAAALLVLRMAYANISIEVIEAGARVYERGVSKGLYDKDIEGLARTKILLLGPVRVPIGCPSIHETLKARYGFEEQKLPITEFAPFAQAVAHIGPEVALFEATHGPNEENPSGLIHAGILMLLHLGDVYNAQRIHNAWLRTMEEGIQGDAQAFADAVVERFGEEPKTVAPAHYHPLDI